MNSTEQTQIDEIRILNERLGALRPGKPPVQKFFNGKTPEQLTPTERPVALFMLQRLAVAHKTSQAA